MLQQFKQKSVKKDKDYIMKSPQFVFTGMRRNEAPIKLQETELWYSQNCYVRDGKWMERPGLIYFGNGLPLPDPVMHIEQFFKYDGTEYLVLFTTKHIYQYNIATQYWDLISPNSLIDDGESIWTGTPIIVPSLSTEWKRYGTYSLKLSIISSHLLTESGDLLTTESGERLFDESGITSAGQIAYHNISLVDLHTYTHVHFYIKSTIKQAAGDLQLILYNSSTQGAESLNSADTQQLTGLAFDTSVDFEQAAALSGHDIMALSAQDLTNLGILPNVTLPDNATVPPLTVDIPLDMEMAIAKTPMDINPLTAQDLSGLGILPDLSHLPDVNVPRFTIFQTDMPFDLEKSLSKGNTDLAILTAGDLQNLGILPTAPTGTVRETLNLPALEAGVETEVSLLLANPAADVDINSIGLKIVVDNGSGDIYIDEIRASIGFNATESDRWSCETIYDNDSSEVKFIATNGIDPVLYWNGNGYWANLPGYPNKAKFVKTFYTWLLLLNCTVAGNPSPQRIDWCVPGNPKDWSGAGSGTNTLAASTGPIMGCEILRGQLAILLERSICMMYPTGTIPPFTFDENKILDVGCMAAGSIQSLGETLLFLGWDNFYVFDGFSCVPVGDDIALFFLENINPGYVDTMFSHMIEEHNLYLLFHPTTASTTPDDALIYDYSKNKWIGIWNFISNMSADGYYRAGSALTIGQLTMRIGAMNWKIGTNLLQNIAPYDLLGDVNGYTYRLTSLAVNDVGYAIDAYFDTKSFMPNVGMYSRFVKEELYCTGSSLETHVSIDDGVNFSQYLVTTLDQSEETPNVTDPFDITNEKAMFRFRNADIDGWFHFTGFRYYYIEKDEEI